MYLPYFIFPCYQNHTSGMDINSPQPLDFGLGWTLFIYNTVHSYGPKQSITKLCQSISLINWREIQLSSRKLKSLASMFWKVYSYHEHFSAWSKSQHIINKKFAMIVLFPQLMLDRLGRQLAARAVSCQFLPKYVFILGDHVCACMPLSTAYIFGHGFCQVWR